MTERWRLFVAVLIGERLRAGAGTRSSRRAVEDLHPHVTLAREAAQLGLRRANVA